MSDLHSAHARNVIVVVVGLIVAGPSSVGDRVRDGHNEWNPVARFTSVWDTLESHGVALEIAVLEHLDDASLAAVHALEHDRLDRAGGEQAVEGRVVILPGAAPLFFLTQLGEGRSRGQNVGLDDEGGAFAACILVECRRADLLISGCALRPDPKLVHHLRIRAHVAVQLVTAGAVC